MNNKKKDNKGRIVLIILIISLIIFYLVIEWRRNYSQNVYESTYNILLFGDNEITVYEGEEYQEEGYLALDYNNNDKTSLVKREENVNYNQEGTYEIIYQIKNKYKNNYIKRIIHVIENPLQDIDFIINGNNEINLLVDSDYNEEGFIALKNGEDFAKYVRVSNNIDTSKVGQYEVNYILKIGNKEKELVRKVNVISNYYTVEFSTLDIVNSEINIKVTSSIPNFKYFMDSTGRIITEPSYDFNVLENGIYSLELYDQNNKKVDVDIEVKNIDKTSPTGNCIASVSNKITTYLITANDENGIAKYVHNNKEYTVSSFKVSFNENDNITIYDMAGNKKTITCEYEPLTSSNNNVIARYNSETLKYVVEKPSNSYTVTHIWVKDPVNQLKTEVNQNTPGTLELASMFLSNAIQRNGYSNKGMISVNASGFIMHSDSFWKYSGWQDKTYHYSTRAPFIASNGKIVRDWTRDVLPSGKIYVTYGLKDNGYFNDYQYKGGSNNVNYNISITNKIKSDGVGNSFYFHPVLLKDYQNVVENVKDSSLGENNLRQAICQINRNNFVIVSNLSTSSDSNKLTQNDRDRGFSHKSMASYMKSLGCRTAYNMDGGGSMSLYYKYNTPTINNIRTSSRKIADIVYFVEK